MRSIYFCLGFLLLAVTGFGQRTIHGDGSDYNETRNITSFDKLHNSISAEVILQKGTGYSVKIEGEKNVVQELVTEVRDGELSIKFPWMKNIQMTRPLRVFVTMPNDHDLKEISNSGSGGILSKDRFKTGNMSLHNSGSGGIAVMLDAEELDLGMSGSGHIDIKGQAHSLHCNISGSGSVRGDELAVQEHSEIHISGSGSCTVHTDGVLEGRISGSGDIRYLGNPSSVNVSHSGSGRAHKVS